MTMDITVTYRSPYREDLHRTNPDAFVHAAAAFAIGAHGNQTRKYTPDEPYWHHLCRVATLTNAFLVSHTPPLDDHVSRYSEVVAAAWLHDTIEDTPTKLRTIEELFGPGVAYIVHMLTEYPNPNLNRKARKDEQATRLANATFSVQVVKMFDLADNTVSIFAHDKDFAVVYLREKRRLLECMTKVSSYAVNQRLLDETNEMIDSLRSNS